MKIHIFLQVYPDGIKPLNLISTTILTLRAPFAKLALHIFKIFCLSGVLPTICHVCLPSCFRALSTGLLLCFMAHNCGFCWSWDILTIIVSAVLQRLRLSPCVDSHLDDTLLYSLDHMYSRIWAPSAKSCTLSAADESV